MMGRQMTNASALRYRWRRISMCGHIKRHGVNGRVQRVPSGTFEVATVLLNEVVDGDYDLLVMGG